MPRKKARYHYNTHTLKYERIEVTWKQRLLKLFGQGAAILTLTGILFIVAYYFIDSPKEKQLKREIYAMKFEYELLNEKLGNFQKILQGLQDRDDNIYRVIFEAEPIPSSVRQAGSGGSNKYDHLEYYDNKDLIISTYKRLDKMSKQLYIQSKSYDDIHQMIKNKEDMLASIPAIQPISKTNTNLQRIASGFGYRVHPIYKTVRMHTGLDFTAPPGTEIYCTGNGVVLEVDHGSGYGRNVMVDHGFGYKTIYAHMKEIKVRSGQKVKRGDVLGTVGNTGLSTAPHLHYEVMKNGKKVDPINYFYQDLSAEEYDMVIDLASRHNQSFD